MKINKKKPTSDIIISRRSSDEIGKRGFFSLVSNPNRKRGKTLTIDLKPLPIHRIQGGIRDLEFDFNPSSVLLDRFRFGAPEDAGLWPAAFRAGSSSGLSLRRSYLKYVFDLRFTFWLFSCVFLIVWRFIVVFLRGFGIKLSFFVHALLIYCLRSCFWFYLLLGLSRGRVGMVDWNRRFRRFFWLWVFFEALFFAGCILFRSSF